MIGEIDLETDSNRRTFLAVDATEHAYAFITYVPVYGERPGYLHDLTRRTTDAPPGTLELCNPLALKRFQDEGVDFLHFGFTPFIVDDQPTQGTTNHLVHRIVNWLRKHGQRLYPADSQAAYKKKWGADFVQREYIAVRPLSMRAVWDLLRLTQSV